MDYKLAVLILNRTAQFWAFSVKRVVFSGVKFPVSAGVFKLFTLSGLT